MTPLLVLMFGFHPATAVGTDLLYASVTKSVGTAVHRKGQTVDWKIVGGLARGSIPAAIVTLFAMAGSESTSAQSASSSTCCSAARSSLTSIAVFFRPWILSWAGHHIDAMAASRVTPLDDPARRDARRAGVA